MIETIDRAVVRANQILLMVILGAMTSVIFANVALRYLTDVSILWAEEVARYLMIWLTFLGAGLVLRYGGHLAVDNLQDALGPGAAKGLRVLILALVAVFCGFMIWIGVGFVGRTWAQTTPVTDLPFGLVYAAMPVGCGLILLHLLMIGRRFVVDRRYDTQEGFDPSASGSL